jgi:hypothetical protein
MKHVRAVPPDYWIDAQPQKTVEGLTKTGSMLGDNDHAATEKELMIRIQTPGSPIDLAKRRELA